MASSLNASLKQAAKAGSLHKNTGLSYTERAKLEATILASYAPLSSTIENNPELVAKFSEEKERDYLLDYNVLDRYKEDWFHYYSRTPFIDPYNTNRRTKEYLFFTKPDLQIIKSDKTNIDLTAHSPFFADAVSRYPNVVEQLQSSYYGTENPGYLAPLLSNAVTNSLELPGISADYMETGKNVYQTMISYRGTSYKSDQDYDFSLEFRDSKFLDVYMYFRMYDEYERLKWMGYVNTPLHYVKNKILHDQFSIYKIITAEDGMTILYWARAMGVYPITVPRDSISNIEGELTFSVNFKAQFVYDMDPRILIDLNKVAATQRRNASNKLPLFNANDKQFEGTWASSPEIYFRPVQDTEVRRRNKYYLLWRYNPNRQF